MFLPWSSIKAQILVDFLVKRTILDELLELEESKSLVLTQDHACGPTHIWKVYVDGSSNIEGSGAWIVIEVQKRSSPNTCSTLRS